MKRNTNCNEEGRRMNEDEDELHYYFNGIESLTQLLEVALEIAAETGMQDWVIVRRGVRMAYCRGDALAVIGGRMSEMWYVERNIL